MEKITFHQVIPQVFASHDDLQSDIWQNDVVFAKGMSYLVEAESGKGKSTFCSYLLGYRHDYTGQIYFDAEDIAQYGISRWVDVRQKHISLLFQEMRLFPELTAMENVQIKNRLLGLFSKEQIEHWFDMLGVADKMRSKAGLLSQGQQQRVAMIRAMVQPYDFLIVDEPISHLDDVNAKLMADMIFEANLKVGGGIIVTSIGKNLPFEYDSKMKL